MQEIAQEETWDPANPYSLIRIEQNTNDEEVVCDICLDDEDYEDDEIVICDLCLVAVHQTCYGGKLKNAIPAGSWYCDRCQELVNNKQKKCTEIKCFLCPDIDGAMKRVETGAKNADLWAHLVCINWHPDIWFKNDEKVHLEGAINKDRFQLRCNCCRTSEGSCI